MGNIERGRDALPPPSLHLHGLPARCFGGEERRQEGGAVAMVAAGSTRAAPGANARRGLAPTLVLYQLGNQSSNLLVIVIASFSTN